MAYNGLIYPPSQEVIYVEDFIIESGTSVPFWNISGGGTGSNANIPVAPDSGHPGVIFIFTGTTTSGYEYASLGALATTNGSFVLGGGLIDLVWVIKLPALSNGTDTYNLSVGMGSQNVSPPANFVGFQYSSTLNSGNWTLQTNAAGTGTQVNSTVAATTNWTRLRVQINANASTCTFFVGDVSVGTISTNIPTLTINPEVIIAKTAGTTSVGVNLDYMRIYQLLTSPR
jgi:hypothetical protein